MLDEIITKLRRMNWVMTLCVVALLILGIVFIWSAGSARQQVKLQNLWQVQAGMAVFGLGLYFFFAMVDYRKILDLVAIPSYGLSLLFLVLVLFFGAERFGGRRWLWFFQPSETAKLAVIIFVAHLFGKVGHENFWWFLIAMAVLGVPSLLILKEPDLGTALVLVPSILLMLLAARVWTKGLLVLLLLVALVAGSILTTVYMAETQTDSEKREELYHKLPLKEHQLQRLRVFLFPSEDQRGAGYNLHQAKISIGSGSVWGKGIRKGSQKMLGYLPPVVSMNDFIFAVLAEEMGFMGSLLMLGLFLGLLISGMRIAFLTTDDRGRLLTIGVITLVFCHLYINVAMSIGLMPITGLPLPFISAGRTFLLVLMVALGFVQSVQVHQDVSET